MSRVSCFFDSQCR